jgi:hydrogenase maturation protease
MQRVTVLVCGESMRGDDGVADAIVRQLSPTTLGLAEIRHVGGLMPDDLVDAPGPVIIVDAVSGPPPGEVIDLPLATLHAEPGAAGVPSSSHAIPLTTAIALAERIAGHPIDGRFIGIAGERYGLGEILSPSVVDAIPGCAARLGHWIRALAHPHAVAPCA